MRKLVIVLSLLVIAGTSVLVACKKESNRFVESVNPDENRKCIMTLSKTINEYSLGDMQSYTTETQALIFAELTPENQARMVRERLDYAIALESNIEKVEKLNMLKSMITPSLYALDRDPEIAENVVEYVECILPLFGFDEMKLIVTTWGASGTDTPDLGPEEVKGYGVNCSCSSEDDWCSGLGTCGNKECDAIRWGCGTLFISSCDGRCSLGTPRNMIIGLPKPYQY